MVIYTNRATLVALFFYTGTNMEIGTLIEFRYDDSYGKTVENCRGIVVRDEIWNSIFVIIINERGYLTANYISPPDDYKLISGPHKMIFNSEPKRCICDIKDLMISGCKCGIK